MDELAARPDPGSLDWYTVLGGVLVLVALALHGSLYLAMKTAGGLERRCRNLAQRLWWAVVAITALSLPATVFAHINSLANYERYPAAFFAPCVVFLSLLVIFCCASRQKKTAFLASCAYLAGMLSGAAAGLFPVLLPTVGSKGRDLTIALAQAGPHTLEVGLVWWSIGILLAIGYAGVVYGLFRGKVDPTDESYGH